MTYITFRQGGTKVLLYKESKISLDFNDSFVYRKIYIIQIMLKILS